MFKNYLKTAVRNLLRRKTNTVINIAGLAVGFAAFLLIFLVVHYEQSFDAYHKAGKKVYRVVRIGRNPVNREYRAGVPFPVTQGLRTEFPQLVTAGAIFGNRDVQVNLPAPDGKATKKFKEQEGVFLAEPQFFSMFDFGLAQGDIHHALENPNTLLLTKATASKYFGDWKQATGKTLKIFGRQMEVTGILNDPPSNTDFPLKVVVSYKTLTAGFDMSDWGSISDENYCFIQLGEKDSPARFSKLLTQFTDKHIRPVNPGYELALQPLSEVHYDSRYGNFTGRTFGKDLILALQLIGIFLLVIACVNFINLSTAQAVNRAREVGVRKVLGGSRKQLIFQFLGETAVVALLALIGAVLIVLICIPAVNTLMEITLSTAVLYGRAFLLFALAAFVLVTLLAGFYPALVQSAFNTVEVLKSVMPGKRKKGISLRHGLVVFQFVIAQVLIIGTLVVASQMNYFRQADMGFKKDAVINASLPGDSLSRTKIEVLRTELSGIPGITSLSLSAFTPSGNGGWYVDLNRPENTSNEPDMIVSMKPADTSFFHLYEMELLAGRMYFASDTMREVVVNEAVVRKLTISTPAKAIGRMVKVGGKLYPIVGVVKDFHTQSLRDPIGGVVMTTDKNSYGIANIKVNMAQAPQVIARMKELWAANFPDYVFEYDFLEQTVAAFYKQENQLSTLYKIFTGIAIFISCLGLYGLIAFMAAQRKKEIGIRKVLGAPVKDILVLLSKEFTLLISIAFVIAAPVAWYFMHQWLQQYTYRISFGATFFIVTITGSLMIAWITVAYTAIRAATANPVKSLRTE